MSGPNATVWSNQEGEFSQTTASLLVDASGQQLVDASTTSLIDGGISFSAVPTTVWSTNDTA